MLLQNIYPLSQYSSFSTLTFSASSAAFTLGSYGMGSPRKVRNFTGNPP